MNYPEAMNEEFKLLNAKFGFERAVEMTMARLGSHSPQDVCDRQEFYRQLAKAYGFVGPIIPLMYERRPLEVVFARTDTVLVQ